MDLDRFLKAQENSYKIALDEIKKGYKASHWMWYIFPQFMGLGMSDIAKYYEIKSIKEAKEYLENDTLRNRLIEISEALLSLDDDITNIMGYPDNLKLKSSMTLFDYASSIDTFSKVLDKFYDGKKDDKTLSLIRRHYEHKI